MASIQPPTGNVYSTMRNMHWSPKEKAIARQAFDRALHQELGATIQEAKQMAHRIEQPDELWALERHLTNRRKEIDAKYEYKYSSVLLVLAELVRNAESAWMTCVVCPKTSYSMFAITLVTPRRKAAAGSE